MAIGYLWPTPMLFQSGVPANRPASRPPSWECRAAVPAAAATATAALRISKKNSVTCNSIQLNLVKKNNRAEKNTKKTQTKRKSRDQKPSHVQWQNRGSNKASIDSSQFVVGVLCGEKKRNGKRWKKPFTFKSRVFLATGQRATGQRANELGPEASRRRRRRRRFDDDGGGGGGGSVGFRGLVQVQNDVVGRRRSRLQTQNSLSERRLSTRGVHTDPHGGSTRRTDCQTG